MRSRSRASSNSGGVTTTSARSKNFTGVVTASAGRGVSAEAGRASESRQRQVNRGRRCIGNEVKQLRSPPAPVQSLAWSVATKFYVTVTCVARVCEALRWVRIGSVENNSTARLHPAERIDDQLLE